MIVKNVMHSLFSSIIVLLFLCAPPASAEEGDATAEYQAGFYYTVREGDTLWDLSNRFADSPWQWPELWHHNTQLTNPHWIYPGQRIRIYQKSWIGNLIRQEAIAPEAIEVREPDVAPTFYFSSIDSIGYVKKDPTIPSGAVFKVKDDKEMISRGDMVYVSPTDGRSFTPGERYTVYRTFTKLKDPSGKKGIGTQYYLTGIVRITHVEPEYAIGHISRSYRTIEIGDQLTPYHPRSSEIELTDSITSLEGRIIASEEHASLMGDNTIAFIDKGMSSGVKPGQMYHIYYQDRHALGSNGKESGLLEPVNFGELLVLHTEATTATVLITRTDKSVFPGSRVHAAADSPLY